MVLLYLFDSPALHHQNFINIHLNYSSVLLGSSYTNGKDDPSFFLQNSLRVSLRTCSLCLSCHKQANHPYHIGFPPLASLMHANGYTATSLLYALVEQ